MEQNKSEHEQLSPDIILGVTNLGETLKIGNQPLPVLYSKHAIYVFSVLFSVIAGAILLSINVVKLNRRKHIVPIVTFAVCYIVTVLFALDFLESKFDVSFTSTLIFTIIGGLLISRLLWGQYIGDDIVYMKRKVWIPALICSGVSIFYLIFYISGMIQMINTLQEIKPFPPTNSTIEFVGGKIEYDSKLVLKNDAKAIGFTLQTIGYFDRSTTSIAYLTRNDQQFTITLLVKDEYFNSPELNAMLSNYAQFLKKEYSNLKSFRILQAMETEDGQFLIKEITSEDEL